MGGGGKEEASSLTRGSLWEQRVGRVSPLPGSWPRAQESLVNFVPELPGLGIRHPPTFPSGSAVFSLRFLICKMGLLRNTVYWREVCEIPLEDDTVLRPFPYIGSGNTVI